MGSLYLKVTPVSSADGSVSSATAADVSDDNSCRACAKATSAFDCPRSVASAAAADAVRAPQPLTTTEVARAVTSVQSCAGIVVVTLVVPLAMTCDVRLVGGTR